MDMRTRLCFELSRRFMRFPEERTVDYEAYSDWRNSSLSKSWSSFDDAVVNGKQVLDFGCGDGQLSFFLATSKQPRQIVGVDLNAAAIERARSRLEHERPPGGTAMEFLVGSEGTIPVADGSIDTIVAFDCLEHVMNLADILKEWRRVLAPGGRCLIEWFPYKGPWGPHMESLIPIPWAHVLFGERAMFRAAEAIYDLPEFVPRHWDLNENKEKKENKWKAWSTFAEQNYINELDIAELQRLVRDSGLELARLERRSFGGNAVRQFIGKTLMRLPVLGEYFVMYAVIELVRPKDAGTRA